MEITRIIGLIVLLKGSIKKVGGNMRLQRTFVYVMSFFFAIPLAQGEYPGSRGQEGQGGRPPISHPAYVGPPEERPQGSSGSVGVPGGVPGHSGPGGDSESIEPSPGVVDPGPETNALPGIEPQAPERNGGLACPAMQRICKNGSSAKTVPNSCRQVCPEDSPRSSSGAGVSAR